MRDAAGTPTTGTVRVSLGANPGATTLRGTLSAATDAGGVATFSDLRLDRAAAGYTLETSVAGLSSVVSPAFDIRGGGPNRLLFLDQPQDLVAGATRPAIRVGVVDHLGNPSVDFDGWLHDDGYTQVKAVGGVATFPPVRLTIAGSGLRMRAYFEGFLEVVSDPYAVLAGPPARLRLQRSPGGAPAVPGALPPLAIAAVDVWENVASPAWTQPITVGNASQTRTRTPAGGVALFDDLTGFYAIEATSPGLPPLGTTYVPEHRLEFVQEPTACTSGGTFSPAVTVRVVDLNGATATAATGSVLLESDPLGDYVLAPITNGVATFTAAWTVAGTLRLRARESSGSVAPSAWSAPFTVGPGPVFTLRCVPASLPSAEPGATLPPIEVQAIDIRGNLVTSYAGTVSILFNPPLTGPASQAAVGGRATFAGLSFSGASTLSFGDGARGATCGIAIGAPGVDFALVLDPLLGPLEARGLLGVTPRPVGRPLTIVARVIDAFGSRVRRQGLSIGLGAQSPLVLAGTTQAVTVDGAASFPCTPTVVGTGLVAPIPPPSPLFGNALGTTLVVGPRIDAITPATATPGADVTMTIDGDGFRVPQPPFGHGPPVLGLPPERLAAPVTLTSVAYVSSTRLTGVAPTSFPATFDPGEVGTYQAVVETARGGSYTVPSTWQASSGGLDAAWVSGLALDPADPAHLLAATRSGLFETTNGGASWSRVPELGADQVADVAFDPASGTAWAVTWPYLGGVYRRPAGGRFAKVSARVHRSLTAHPTRSDVLYGLALPPAPLPFTPTTWPEVSDDGGATWRAQRHGISYDLTLAVAFDPSAPSTVWLGRDDGAWRSTQDGFRWTKCNGAGPGALPAAPVDAVAVDAAGAVYAAVRGQGPWRSADGGATWASIAGAGVGSKLLALEAAPGAPGVVWAVSEAGVSYTADAGVTWSTTGPRTAPPAASLVPVAGQPLRAYVALAGAGVFHTTDGGATWALVRSGLVGGGVRSLVRAGGDVFAAVEGSGVWRSSDGGQTWSPRHGSGAGQTPAWDLLCMTGDPNDAATLVAGSATGGLVVTRDGGATWSAGGAGLPTSTVTVIAPVPDGAGAFVDGAFVVGVRMPPNGSRAGLWRTNDRGATWTALPDLPLAQAGMFPTVGAYDVTGLAIDPGTPARMFAAVNFGGAYRAADVGQPTPWTQITGVAMSPYTVAITAGSGATATVRLGGGGGVATSTDGGATWAGPVTMRPVFCLGAAPSDANVIYAGCVAESSPGAVRVTTDGTTWVPAGNGVGVVGTEGKVADDGWSLLVDPADPRVALAGTSGAGVWRTTTGGR